MFTYATIATFVKLSLFLCVYFVLLFMSHCSYLILVGMSFSDYYELYLVVVVVLNWFVVCMCVVCFSPSCFSVFSCCVSSRGLCFYLVLSCLFIIGCWCCCSLFFVFRIIISFLRVGLFLICIIILSLFLCLLLVFPSPVSLFVLLVFFSLCSLCVWFVFFA